MDTNVWVAIIGAVFAGIATLVAAVSAAFVLVFNAKAKTKQDETDAAVKRHEMIADRLEREISRLTTLVGDQQEAIDAITEEHSDCQARLAELWVWVVSFHDHAVRLAKLLRLDPAAELPPLPPKPERQGGPEFRARTMKQAATLTQQASRDAKGGGS